MVTVVVELVAMRKLCFWSEAKASATDLAAGSPMYVKILNSPSPILTFSDTSNPTRACAESRINSACPTIPEFCNNSTTNFAAPASNKRKGHTLKSTSMAIPFDPSEIIAGNDSIAIYSGRLQYGFRRTNRNHALPGIVVVVVLVRVLVVSVVAVVDVVLMSTPLSPRAALQVRPRE